MIFFENKLTKFNEDYSKEEIEKVKKFFEENEKEVKTYKNENKTNIPEKNDLKIICCTEKDNCKVKYILTQDKHFKTYSREIKEKYNLYTLPLEKIKQKLITWGWIE